MTWVSDDLSFLLDCWGDGDSESWRHLRVDRRCGGVDAGEGFSFSLVCRGESGWTEEESSVLGSLGAETAVSGSAISGGAGSRWGLSNESASAVSSGLLTGCWSVWGSAASISSWGQTGTSTGLSSADVDSASICEKINYLVFSPIGCIVIHDVL